MVNFCYLKLQKSLNFLPKSLIFAFMHNTLQEYIPYQAIPDVIELLRHDNLVVKIKNERKTRHGDYRKLPNNKHQITINSNLNHYRFLVTLIHEIAHFEAFNSYGRYIKPHGKEWKHTFQILMLPFLNPRVFPNELLPLLARHFKNPKASSDTDVKLALALKQFDPPNDKTYIFEVPLGGEFKLYNGRVFRKGVKRRTRYEGVEVASGKLYLFNQNAEVELVDG
ncbi:SprT-like family protein [Gelidibacter algens]|uniref:SprT-like family protein n=2 Tax=Gelidibacter algens TaxID=49280 RepID=A0A327RQ30_9FLAO|nr:SprT-like family protein [Gelidibacter algens]